MFDDLDLAFVMHGSDNDHGRPAKSFGAKSVNQVPRQSLVHAAIAPEKGISA